MIGLKNILIKSVIYLINYCLTFSIKTIVKAYEYAANRKHQGQEKVPRKAPFTVRKLAGINLGAAEYLRIARPGA